MPPANAARKNRRVSRTRAYGASYATPFQPSTITRLDAPIPATTRPGAIAASAAKLCASTAAPRVWTGTTAVPSRRAGAHWDARTSGVNASAPAVSDDHTSV